MINDSCASLFSCWVSQSMPAIQGHGCFVGSQSVHWRRDSAISMRLIHNCWLASVRKKSSCWTNKVLLPSPSSQNEKLLFYLFLLPPKFGSDNRFCQGLRSTGPCPDATIRQGPNWNGTRQMFPHLATTATTFHWEFLQRSLKSWSFFKNLKIMPI